jgi:hypothetical protein
VKKESRTNFYSYELRRPEVKGKRGYWEVRTLCDVIHEIYSRGWGQRLFAMRAKLHNLTFSKGGFSHVGLTVKKQSVVRDSHHFVNMGSKCRHLCFWL